MCWYGAKVHLIKLFSSTQSFVWPFHKVYLSPHSAIGIFILSIFRRQYRSTWNREVHEKQNKITSEKKVNELTVNITWHVCHHTIWFVPDLVLSIHSVSHNVDFSSTLFFRYRNLWSRFKMLKMTSFSPFFFALRSLSNKVVCLAPKANIILRQMLNENSYPKIHVFYYGHESWVLVWCVRMRQPKQLKWLQASFTAMSFATDNRRRTLKTRRDDAIRLRN